MGQPYTQRFYADFVDGSRASAAVIVPMVLELVPCRSVVDVGCGIGAWLETFRGGGVEDVLGLDGVHVDPAQLLIPRDLFVACDLSQPLPPQRTFDLALSLEVAEHLPVEASDRFVRGLTRLAPVVLFSAAVPHQGGRGHVNCQWQDSWADRFAREGFATLDVIRPAVWHRADVEYWYAQNTLLFVRWDRLEASPALQEAAQRTRPEWLRVVHPRMLEAQLWYAQDAVADASDPARMRLGRTVRVLPRIAVHALRRRLRRA